MCACVYADVHVPMPVEHAPDEPLSVRRRHSIRELISLTAHHLAPSRRDAVNELRELFVAHPEFCRAHTAAALQSSAPLLADSEASVRKATSQFLQHVVTSTDTVCSDQPLRAVSLSHHRMLTSGR